MRRWLVVCAVAAAILAAWLALERTPTARAASVTSGNLTLTPPTPMSGCPIGPAFTYCNRPVNAVGVASSFTLTVASAVTNLALALQAVPGLSANFAAGDFSILGTTTCGASLAANASCTIDIAFTPAAAGFREAQVLVTDAGGDKLTLSLAGTGSNLALAPPFTPACDQDNALTFCTSGVGGEQTFTLSIGSAATNLTFGFAATQGLESEFNASDFSIATTTCPASPPANSACTVTVVFQPLAIGLRAATLTAKDDQGDSASIALAGGFRSNLVLTRPATPPGCLPYDSLVYCNEPAGGVSATQAFLLQNISGGTISGLTIPAGTTTSNSNSAPDFKVQNTTCTAQLSPLRGSSTCVINVEFTPTAVGLRQGALVVTDANGDVAALDIAGTGDDYSLGLPSSQSLELSVVAGGTATFKAQVNPDAVFGQNGEQVTFACPTNLPTNTSCAITPCPVSVTAGTLASIQITFVTSSATNVAPMSTGGCSGYGPSVHAWLPGGQGPVLDSPRAPGIPARVPLFPALSFAAFALLAIIAAMALIVGRTHALAGQTRMRVPLIFAACILIAATLSGCHHKGTSGPTSATPAGATTMTILGNAVDSNGKALNASRPLQLILDVTAK